MTAPVLSVYRRIARWPAGRWAFSRAICLKAPCFATIAPHFEVLEPGRCEVRMRDRRRVHNHIDIWESPRPYSRAVSAGSAPAW
ncbi:MAG: DUF4442 domain-containing protein [Rhodanobacter sp.]|nr:MAG: DUF4442 domain-containing protein [Rhodanobacter sp.]TAM01997.1 MAG: DUF4442 domain-containing protein [Rhodanobacter sp.]TAM40237.1 MAG: DUF4442 domain-containing protein [Rhodanobacter sp.]TAN27070.1 MAG: DUF4442 domain-containing protein [Rhodanobacter sp.]